MQQYSTMNLLSRPVLKADRRIKYGPGPFQFGDLWLPKTRTQPIVPVVVFFHGGWWKSDYDLEYGGYLCRDLARKGLACWSVEYRRVGASGGGWPATFQDAAAGFDFLKGLAIEYDFDLSRVLVMGHSAGAHLAFWIAGRQRIESKSEIFSLQKVSPKAAIALAGAVDLRLTIELAGTKFAKNKDEVHHLMGGDPLDWPARYRDGNPGDLLPFNARQILIQGTADDQIPPELPSRWAQMACKLGSAASVRMISGADHFDVVDPDSAMWSTVIHEVRGSLL